MFLPTEGSFDCVSIYTHAPSSSSTILINDLGTNFKKFPMELILKNGQYHEYSDTSTQIDACDFFSDGFADLKNVSTLTDFNLSNSQNIQKDGLQYNFIKASNDGDVEISNNKPEMDHINENSIFENIIIDNSIDNAFLFNNINQISNGDNENQDILLRNKNISNCSRNFHKSVIILTEEARKFRDNFYNCCSAKKRFSKINVKNIHNCICGKLGLPKMTRAEFRSIYMYFNNYAPYRHLIINCINQNKELCLKSMDL